jgi:hypothetical protein
MFVRTSLYTLMYKTKQNVQHLSGTILLEPITVVFRVVVEMYVVVKEKQEVCSKIIGAIYKRKCTMENKMSFSAPDV